MIGRSLSHGTCTLKLRLMIYYDELAGGMTATTEKELEQFIISLAIIYQGSLMLRHTMTMQDDDHEKSLAEAVGLLRMKRECEAGRLAWYGNGRMVYAMDALRRILFSAEGGMYGLAKSFEVNEVSGRDFDRMSQNCFAHATIHDTQMAMAQVAAWVWVAAVALLLANVISAWLS